MRPFRSSSLWAQTTNKRWSNSFSRVYRQPSDALCWDSPVAATPTSTSVCDTPKRYEEIFDGCWRRCCQRWRDLFRFPWQSANQSPLRTAVEACCQVMDLTSRPLLPMNNCKLSATQIDHGGKQMAQITVSENKNTSSFHNHNHIIFVVGTKEYLISTTTIITTLSWTFLAHSQSGVISWYNTNEYE